MLPRFFVDSLDLTVHPTVVLLLRMLTHPLFIFLWLLLAYCSYRYVDIPVAFSLQDYFSEASFWVIKTISKLGLALCYVTVFLLLYLVARFVLRHVYLTRVAALLSLTVIVPGLICDVCKIFFGRYRPRMLFSDHLYGFHLFSLDSEMWSLPSGHAVTIMGIMMTLSLLYPRYWKIFFAVGLTVSLTRILLTAHFVSDVMLGMLLGCIGALLCCVWAQRSGTLRRYLFI